MTEFRVLDRSTTPPGGWYYVQPESGREFKHYSRDAFYKDIQSHRLANGYRLEPSWKEEIEDGICKAHPEWGREVCCRVQVLGGRKPISFAAMQAFLNVIVGWLKGIAAGKDPFVSQEEANRRAAICAGCEYNANLGFSCGSCADFVFRMVGRVFHQNPRSTKFDSQLGGCSVCSCALKVAVHVPLEAQQAGLSEKLREEFRDVPWCWKKEGL